MSSGPIEDGVNEQPIAAAWRPTFDAIVRAFVAGDWQLESAPAGVKRLSAEAGHRLSSGVADYGEVTLVPLPPGTWDSSVSMWTGSHWDVLVDLWTEQEGRSDLVLSASVRRSEDGFEFDVLMVYVP